MRIALVQPPLLSSPTVQPPLNLCTLGAHLVRHGHEIRIVDLDLETKSDPSDARQLSERIFLREVASFEPDLVGFTSMYNNSLQAERLLRACKESFPGLPTVAGGSHFGAQGLEAMRRIPALDFVIEGEGETALLSLVRHLAGELAVGDVPSLCHREDGGILRNPRAPLMDLEFAPPVWETIAGQCDLSRYAATISERDTIRGIYIEAGRGCPYRCNFCAPAVFWERKYRVRKPEDVLAEVRFLHEHLGYNSFILVHDLLTVDRDFVAELCDAFLAARLPVHWMANSRIDIRLGPLLAKMRAAGCWKVFFGIESASARIQAVVSKFLDPEASLRTVATLEENGIDTTCSFVIGHPEETRQELSETIGLGARLKLIGSETVQFHRMRLFPPAPIAEPGKAELDFDLDTLRLEFPFREVLASEIEDIRSAKELFSGYFAPRSAAGTPQELAQAELFFTQAVAIVPLTVTALHQFSDGRLVDLLYEIIAEHGAIDRFVFDPTLIDLVRNFKGLEPYLHLFIDKAAASGWQREALEALLAYEKARLFVFHRVPEAVPDLRYLHNDCAEVTTRIRVNEALVSMRQGDGVSQDLLAHGRILLVRQDGGLRGFSL